MARAFPDALFAAAVVPRYQREARNLVARTTSLCRYSALVD